MENFLDAILDKKREAEAHGFTLDIIVLHQDFYGTMMGAVGQLKKASEAFTLHQNPKEKERKDIYLHGIKVLWSNSRLPPRQAWYRYSGGKT
jgi:hypothetical protein